MAVVIVEAAVTGTREITAMAAQTLAARTLADMETISRTVTKASMEAQAVDNRGIRVRVRVRVRARATGTKRIIVAINSNDLIVTMATTVKPATTASIRATEEITAVEVIGDRINYDVNILKHFELKLSNF